MTLDYGISNNGNLKTETVSDGGSWTIAQNFTYDKLNRLESADEPVAGGQGWKRTFAYDRWGNQWIDELRSNGIAADTVTPTGSSWITAKNRLNLSPGSYDRAGNQLKIAGSTAGYDAESRLTSVGSELTYSYDGEGRRDSC